MAVELGSLIVATLEERVERFGPINASGIQLLLADHPIGSNSSTDDLQAILDACCPPPSLGCSLGMPRLVTSP